ncbi:MAG TPA: hypothetical protein VF925_06890, partial [Casimicrobiaceae bacterium]
MTTRSIQAASGRAAPNTARHGRDTAGKVYRRMAPGAPRRRASAPTGQEATLAAAGPMDATVPLDAPAGLLAKCVVFSQSRNLAQSQKPAKSQGERFMSNPLVFALLCAVAAIVYGVVSIRWIL